MGYARDAHRESHVRRFVFCLLAACSTPAEKDASTDGSTDPGTTDTPDSGDTGGTDTPDCTAPDPAPADTREGHPSDGWDWQPLGPLFEDTATLGYTDGDLAPTLVDTGSELVVMFARKEGTVHQLLVSTSADGETWTTPEPVTGLDVSSVEYPSLAYHDGTFHLWHGSGSVAYATSTDGRTFTPGDTVLRTGESGSFDGLSLLYPHAWITNEGVKLYYTGFDGARFAIGLAENATPGDEFAAGTLLLQHDADSWDNTSVGMAEVVPDSTGTPHFWYSGYDTVIADPGPWRIGRWDAETGARSVSLPLSESGVDAWSTRDPAVVPHGDGWLMVYVGMGDDGVYRLLRATSRVCS